MAKKWKGDQLWSLAAASLRDACGNDNLAEVWKESFLQLCSQEKIRKQLEASPATDVARVLLHSFGRSHALIKQAIDWKNPRIGKEGSTSKLDTTRGIMWRYAIAYCGWDRCTNALGITQSVQESILAKVDQPLESPKLTERQRKQILAWTPAQEIIPDDNGQLSLDGSWIQGFLGIRDHYRDFPHWLLSDKPMKQAAILAVLRNMICHGSLLPTKARQWGLEIVFEDGITILAEGVERLLSLLLVID